MNQAHKWLSVLGPPSCGSCHLEAGQLTLHLDWEAGWGQPGALVPETDSGCLGAESPLPNLAPELLGSPHRE